MRKIRPYSVQVYLTTSEVVSLDESTLGGNFQPLDNLDKRRKYDQAFKAEALRVARESRSTQAAARALNIRPNLLCQWQKAAQPPLPANLVEAAEVRQLRAANRRLEQELGILKKVIASKRLMRVISTPPIR